LEGKGLMVRDEIFRVAEFKNGVRDGKCVTYSNREISFEGMCKIEPEGFGKYILKMEEYLKEKFQSH
jgi:hypothetical protein